MNLDLTGKHAIVCGSTQGIGLASAHELASLGARVCLIARNEQSLVKVKGTLPTPSGQAHTHLVADFEAPETLRWKIAEYVADNAPVHILVNNTGGPPGGPVSEATEEAFVRAFRMHVLCNQILVQAVIPGMKAAGYGRIVNVISTSVKQPIPGLGVSNTIRGAVANWSKTLAGELGPFGITANNVLPGATDTVRLHAIIEKKAEKAGVSVEEAAAAMRAAIPARRFARSEEIAGAVAFLASPSAGYINGINLPVDGGRTGCL